MSELDEKTRTGRDWNATLLHVANLNDSKYMYMIRRRTFHIHQIIVLDSRAGEIPWALVAVKDLSSYCSCSEAIHGFVDALQ